MTPGVVTSTAGQRRRRWRARTARGRTTCWTACRRWTRAGTSRRWRSIRTRLPRCASSRRRIRRSTAARAGSRSWASPRAARTSSGARSTTSSGGRPGTANTWANRQNGNREAGLRPAGLGRARSADRSASPAARTSCSSSVSQQVSPRSTGGVINRFRVPTALERQGDFSQSIDTNGDALNLIRDATTGLPCTAADTRGCFQDGGVLGRIPQDRLYRLGLKVLQPLAAAQRERRELQPRDRPAQGAVQHVPARGPRRLPGVATSCGSARSTPGRTATLYRVPGHDSGLQRPAMVRFPANHAPVGDGGLRHQLRRWCSKARGARRRGNERAAQRHDDDRRAPTSTINGLGGFPDAVSGRASSRWAPIQEKVLEADGNVPFYRERPAGAAAAVHVGQPHRERSRRTPLYAGFLCWQRTQDVGAQPDEAVGPAHVQVRPPDAGQPEGAERRHADPRGAPARGRGQLRRTTATTRSTAGSGSRTRPSASSRRTSSRTRCSRGRWSITTGTSTCRTTGR